MSSCPTDCCEEVKECLAVVEENIKELFKRTDDLKTLMEGGGNVATFAIISDFGQEGDADRDTAAALIDSWEPDYVLTAGDNVYPDGDASDVADRLEPFQSYINAEVMFPVLGNHDMDNSGSIGQPLLNHFPYLPKNGNNHSRYYSKYFSYISTEIFFINSGFDSAGAVVEPDGNHKLGEQGTWFDEAIASSVAKWKIAIFHHPYVTSVNSGSAKSVMWWGDTYNGIDLIINGHSHLAEHYKQETTDDIILDVINAGSPTDPRTHTGILYGAVPFDAFGLPIIRQWASAADGATSQKVVVKLLVHPSYLEVTYYNINGSAIYSFTIT